MACVTYVHGGTSSGRWWVDLCSESEPLTPSCDEVVGRGSTYSPPEHPSLRILQRPMTSIQRLVSPIRFIAILSLYSSPPPPFPLPHITYPLSIRPLLPPTFSIRLIHPLPRLLYPLSHPPSLPLSRKNVQRKKAPSKGSKEKKPYSPFPPPQQPSKLDLALESGEYFLSAERKAAQKQSEKMQKQEQAVEERKRQRQEAFQPPKVSGEEGAVIGGDRERGWVVRMSHGGEVRCVPCA